jgi:hypothetical protein
MWARGVFRIVQIGNFITTVPIMVIFLLGQASDPLTALIGSFLVITFLGILPAALLEAGIAALDAREEIRDLRRRLLPKAGAAWRGGSEPRPQPTPAPNFVQDPNRPPLTEADLARLEAEAAGKCRWR